MLRPLWHHQRRPFSQRCTHMYINYGGVRGVQVVNGCGLWSVRGYHVYNNKKKREDEDNMDRDLMSEPEEYDEVKLKKVKKLITNKTSKEEKAKLLETAKKPTMWMSSKDAEKDDRALEKDLDDRDIEVTHLGMRWWSDEEVIESDEVPDAVKEHESAWTQKDDYIEQDHPMFDWMPGKEKDPSIPSRVYTERDIKELVREADQSTGTQLERRYTRNIGDPTELLPEDHHDVTTDLIGEQAALTEFLEWQSSYLHPDATEEDMNPIEKLLKTPNTAVQQASEYTKAFQQIVVDKANENIKAMQKETEDQKLLQEYDMKDYIDPWDEYGKDAEIDVEKLQQKYMGDAAELMDVYEHEVPPFLKDTQLQDYQYTKEQGEKMMNVPEEERRRILKEEVKKFPKWTEIPRRKRPKAVNAKISGGKMPVTLELLNSQIDDNVQTPDHTGRIIRKMSDKEFDEFEEVFRKVYQRHYMKVVSSPYGHVPMKEPLSTLELYDKFRGGLLPPMVEINENLVNPDNWKNKRFQKRFKKLTEKLDRDFEESGGLKADKRARELLPFEKRDPADIDYGTLFEHHMRGNDPHSQIMYQTPLDVLADHQKIFWEETKEREVRERQRPTAFSPFPINEVEHFRGDRDYELMSEPWKMDDNFRRYMNRNEDTTTVDTVASRRSVDVHYRHEDPDREEMLRRIDPLEYEMLKKFNEDHPISYDEIYVPDSVRETMFRLWRHDKVHWDHRRLSRRFGLSLRRVRAILQLKLMQVSYEKAGLMKRELFAWNDTPLQPIHDFEHLLEAGKGLSRGEIFVTEYQRDMIREDEERYWTARRLFRVPPRSKYASPLDGKRFETGFPNQTPLRHRVVYTDLSTKHINKMEMYVRECDGTTRHLTKDEYVRFFQREYPRRHEQLYRQPRVLGWTLPGRGSAPRHISLDFIMNRWPTKEQLEAQEEQLKQHRRSEVISIDKY